jgi:hypothetical protein
MNCTVGSDGITVYCVISGPRQQTPLTFDSLVVTNDTTTPTTKIDISATSIVVTDGTNYPTLYNVSVVINTGAFGANGMDVGVIGGTAAWVHNYVIYNPATQIVAGLSTLTSPTTGLPTLPSGYTQYRYVGSMHWSGSALLVIRQEDDLALCDSQQIITTGSTTQSWSTVDCSSFMPPTSRWGLFLTEIVSSSGVSLLQLRQYGSTTTIGYPMSTQGTGTNIYSLNEAWAVTDSSQRLQLNVTGSPQSWQVTIMGWKLNL